MTAERQPRYHSDKTLLKIRRRVVKLGGLVVDNLERAEEAVVDDRLELVSEVVDADKVIDKRYTKLDSLTFMAIAQQKPTDGDLRFLVSSTRLLYELERSGDLVVNIANLAKRIKGLPDSPVLRDLLRRLFAESGRMLERAMDVFDKMDAVGGAQLDAEDDVVDDLVAEFYSAIKAEGIELDSGIALNRMGRFLERIADHAVNVGTNTAYIVTGEFPRRTEVAGSENE